MIVNYLFVAILLLLLAGLNIDSGLLQAERSRADFCARAAATAMSFAKQRAFTTSDITAAGRAAAALNGYTDGVNNVHVTYEMPPTAGTYSGVSNAARVVVTKNIHNTLMSLIGFSQSTISAEYSQVGYTNVDLSSLYNRWDIWTDYTHIQNGGVDLYGPNNAAFSENALASARMQSNRGPLLSWRGYLFALGPPNVADAVAQSVVPLPQGQYSQLLFITVTAIGSTTGVTFTVTYTDGSTASTTFDTKDWCKDQYASNSGSDPVVGLPYRLMNVQDDKTGPSYLSYKLNFMNGHAMALNKSKTVKQVALPTQTGPEITVLAMNLIR